VLFLKTLPNNNAVIGMMSRLGLGNCAAPIKIWTGYIFESWSGYTF
jgi:hypothetical protein